jgi:anti-sigma factor RsiW
MTNPDLHACDEILLNRYLDKDFDEVGKARMQAHMGCCQQCRRQVAAMRALSDDLRDQVKHVCDGVDFLTLEKQVVYKARRKGHSRGAFSAFMASFKYTLPATVAVGIVLFFVYTHFVPKPAPLPSAIIHSFTGSVSSVMIFETPETRQTILWYNEEINAESEQDAV